MPQPGMNGMEPAFGEAFGGHRGLRSPCPPALSPQEGRTEYDQTVLLMLGSPASPRKRPFELLSDLVDDGGFGEDQHPERWDVSALDEMTRYTKLGLGGVGEPLACPEEGVLMGCWGRNQEEEERRTKSKRTVPPVALEVQAAAEGKEEQCASVPTAAPGGLCAAGGGQDAGMLRERTVEVYQVVQEEEEVTTGLGLEHCSEEHNYSLSQGGQLVAGPEEKEDQEVRGSEESSTILELKGDEDEKEEEEETTAEFSSSSESECEVEAEPTAPPGERPTKRRCFWEYRRTRESAPKKKVGGDVHWSLSWSASTLPSTLYRREGKKGRRKARKTDASDLTPNPQKLHSIGEQLQKLNAAIDGMGPVNDLPAVARARSRKEKNKLASREPVGISAAHQGGDQEARGEHRGGGARRPRDDPAPGGHPEGVQRSVGRRSDQRLRAENSGGQQSEPAGGPPAGGGEGSGVNAVLPRLPPPPLEMNKRRGHPEAVALQHAPPPRLQLLLRSLVCVCVCVTVCYSV
uniref:Uncharacterized protein n=1 Tax=Oryzias latipes TaxID=8090 RepID=A0A3P9MNL8_ORYLA